MFRRLIHEHSQDVLPMLAFALTFIVFAVAVARALLTRREIFNRIALLPLENAEPPAKARPCGDTCRQCIDCRHVHSKV